MTEPGRARGGTPGGIASGIASGIEREAALFSKSMNGKGTRILGAAIALVIAGASGCKRAQPPVNGLGGYELGRTTLATVEQSARCIDQGAWMRCLAPAQAIAGKNAQIELDFAGKDPDALLVEILLEVPGCNYDELTGWLSERVGNPEEKTAQRTSWSTKHIFMTARVVGPSRCHVIAASPKDTERVERLRQQ